MRCVWSLQAIRRPSSSASQASSTGGGKVEGIKGPRRQGESEMLTIDELRDDVDDRFEDVRQQPDQLPTPCSCRDRTKQLLLPSRPHLMSSSGCLGF